MTGVDIERAALEVLDAYEIHRPPVDPFGLARKEGIRLAPGQYDGCFDGRIEFRGRGGLGQFYLFYAETEPPWRPEGRVRFSVAHELGHFYLPRHREYLMSGHWHGSKSGFVSDRPAEREADNFATELLMPRGWFTERVRMRGRSNCTIGDLERLADEVFKTSLTSTAIRYVHLSFEPCCVVLSQDGDVLYGVRSEDMRRLGLGWVDRGGRIPSASVTGKMASAMMEGKTPRAGGPVDSEVWFSTARPRPLWEEAKSLGRTGLTLTLLSVEGADEDDD